MNFEALELLVRSIVSNYKCDNCSNQVSKKDIKLIWLDWNKAVLEVKCNTCQRVAVIKSEIMSIDMTKNDLFNNKLTIIKNSMNKREQIKDSLIIQLDKDLKKEKLNVEDLFKE